MFSFYIDVATVLIIYCFWIPVNVFVKTRIADSQSSSFIKIIIKWRHCNNNKKTGKVINGAKIFQIQTYRVFALRKKCEVQQSNCVVTVPPNVMLKSKCVTLLSTQNITCKWLSLNEIDRRVVLINQPVKKYVWKCFFVILFFYYLEYVCWEKS